MARLSLSAGPGATAFPALSVDLRKLARCLFGSLHTGTGNAGESHANMDGGEIKMCRLFRFSPLESYSAKTRRLRIHGHSTSVRLETSFWQMLERMAQAEGKSLSRLVTSLHDEVRQSDADLPNFASCLRVIALQYGVLYGQNSHSFQEARA